MKNLGDQHEHERCGSDGFHYHGVYLSPKNAIPPRPTRTSPATQKGWKSSSVLEMCFSVSVRRISSIRLKTVASALGSAAVNDCPPSGR